MKRCIAVFSVIVLAMSLGACKKNDGHNDYREIYERYNKMTSYSATAEVIVRNERTENSYVARQLFLAPDKFLSEVVAPEEIEGSGFVFKEGALALKSGNEADVMIGDVPLVNVGVLSVNSFFESYYKSEETIVLASGSAFEEATILECFLNSKNRNRFRQRLWVDNKTYLPLKLETYDIENKPVVTVIFREFDRNCKFDESEFD